MPALELAVLTKCEYAKPRKPAGKNTEHEMCDPARRGNRGDARGGENRFHWLALATGPDGKSTEETTMYLMLFEDGEIKSAEDVTDDDLRAVDDGVLEVIDISDPFTPSRYIGGAWHEVSGIDD